MNASGTRRKEEGGKGNGATNARGKHFRRVELGQRWLAGRLVHARKDRWTWKGRALASCAENQLCIVYVRRRPLATGMSAAIRLPGKGDRCDASHGRPPARPLARPPSSSWQVSPMTFLRGDALPSPMTSTYAKLQKELITTYSHSAAVVVVGKARPEGRDLCQGGSCTRTRASPSSCARER